MRSTCKVAAMASGRVSRPSRTSRIRRCSANSCNERERFNCARPVSATTSVVVAGFSRSNTLKSSNASRDRSASKRAAGSGEARPWPLATARISSFKSTNRFAHHRPPQFPIRSRRSRTQTRRLPQHEPAQPRQRNHNQFIGTSKFVRQSFMGLPEAVPMVVLVLVRNTVGVIRKRIFQPLRSRWRRWS